LFYIYDKDELIATSHTLEAAVAAALVCGPAASVQDEYGLVLPIFVVQELTQDTHERLVRRASRTMERQAHNRRLAAAPGIIPLFKDPQDDDEE
jgi:hypothetical protein